MVCKACYRKFSFEQSPAGRGYCLVCSSVILGIGASETLEQFKAFYEEYPEYQRLIPLVLDSLGSSGVVSVEGFLGVLNVGR